MRKQPLAVNQCRRLITIGQPHPGARPNPPPALRRLEPLSTPATPERTSSPRDPTPGRRPINDQIPFSHVYVLDPATHARSPTKHSLAALLAVHTRPPHRRVVELLAAGPEPLVRVVTRAEVEARYREMRRAARHSARTGGAAHKEVQLTWGVAWADVLHKLRKARRDLDKGYRVVVTIVVKRGHRPSGRHELVAFADQISQELSGAGQECKEREITERSMVLTFRKVEVDEND